MKPIDMSVKNLKDKYEKLIQETRAITNPILDKDATPQQEPGQRDADTNPNSIYKTCGTFEKVGKKKAKSKDKARKKAKQIHQDVKGNPTRYPAAARAVNRIKQGSPSMQRTTELSDIGVPKWVKELKGIVKGFGKPLRKRGKKDYDIESLVRGVVEKEQAREKKKEVVVYTIFDTSGSMGSVIGDFAKFLPQIVKPYDGEILMIDTEITAIYDNSELRKAFAQGQTSVRTPGGGGTVFDQAYEYIINQLTVKRGNTDRKYQAVVLVLTDGYVYVPINLVKEVGSSVFVLGNKGQYESFARSHPEFMALVNGPDPAYNIIDLQMGK